MSKGILVFAADGTVVLDTTKHVWSVVQTGFVPKWQSISFPLPPEIYNADIEVVLTKWNGVVPTNYFIAPAPVYGITDNAVNRITELLFVDQNLESLRDDPYDSLPDTLDIANHKIIYMLFIPYLEIIDKATEGARRIYYNDEYYEGSGPDFSYGEDELYGTIAAMQALGFSLIASYAMMALGLMSDDWGYRRDSTFDSYSDPYGNLINTDTTFYQVIRQMVYEVGMKANMGYNIDDAVLNTYTAPIARGSTSRRIKTLPSWSISDNQIKFEADGDEIVRFEVYAK
jgi:hypothetical protein